MITIIDYNASNLTSVQHALDFLGIPNRISADPQVVRASERIIFPGVGHAGAAMSVVRERQLGEALREAFAQNVPILGICLGCQIILSSSEEGETEGLDIIPGRCVRFKFTDSSLKIPHMGWNAVTVRKPHPILSRLAPGDEFYFVHSYYPQPVEVEAIYATCEYGTPFPAAIGRGSLFAVQFHAEKSGPLGLRLLQNFAEWVPC